jgi:hypothetical protein
MNYRSIAALSTLVAASALAAPGLANAATPMNADRESTGLASQLLQDANAARSALMNDDVATANHDIDEAMNARDKMLDLARGNGSATIVPIFSELEDTTVVSTDGTAKPAPASAVLAPVTVRSNDAQYTYLAIDLNKAKARLDAAKLALRNKNTQAAEDSLSAIGTDLVASTDATDVPLLTAREDLALAQRALQAKQLTAAAADLHQASTSLKSYDSPGHAADAQRLANDIQTAMPLTPQTAESASAKLDGWWSSVKSWFSQHA